MSEENVELLRRAHEAWVSPDPEHAAPEFEYQSRVLGRVFTGLDGMRKYRSELREIWGDYDLEPMEFIDLGDAHVMTVLHLVARGAASGIPIDQMIFVLWTIKHGKLLRSRVFASKAEALEAVGLRE
jgi:ketosteroid isomerase-like protein